MYKLIFSPRSTRDLLKLQQSEPAAYKKASKLIDELKEHPLSGTGHPENLKGKPENRWSRSITKKHRLVYRVFDTEVHVEVLQAWGHYDDK